jgi:hypothetical protein
VSEINVEKGAIHFEADGKISVNGVVYVPFNNQQETRIREIVREELDTAQTINSNPKSTVYYSDVESGYEPENPRENDLWYQTDNKDPFPKVYFKCFKNGKWIPVAGAK